MLFVFIPLRMNVISVIDKILKGDPIKSDWNSLDAWNTLPYKHETVEFLLLLFFLRRDKNSAKKMRAHKLSAK